MAVLYGKKKKGWRSALSLLLAFCLVAAPLSLGGIAARAAGPLEIDLGVNPESVKAVLASDGTLTVSGVGEMRDFTPESAPFADKHVTSLKISSGVSSLGAYAFYGCGRLTGELVLPDGLSAIGTGAFSGSSPESAPRFTFIRNNFVQCMVTGKKDAAPAAGPAAPETGADPVEQTGGEPETEGGAQPASQPEASQEPEPAPTAEPTSEPTSAPSAAPENQYTVETLTQQRVGENVFYPGSGTGAYFLCSDANESFRLAAEQGGYQRSDRMIPAAFQWSAQDGGVKELELPVSDGMVRLPGLPGEASAPDGNALFAYTFGGWVESLDDVGTVRKEGSSFLAGARESLYFHAVWNKETLVKLRSEVKNGRMTLSVPPVSGYEVLSCVWQVCELDGTGIPENTGSLAWSTIDGETGAEYVRELVPGDEHRAFRCLVTVKKKSAGFRLFSASSEEEETFGLDPVPGVQAYAAAGQVSFARGSYEEDAAVTIGGEDMDPVWAGPDGNAVVPECSYTASGGTAVVFCGWKDSGGVHYDPGDLVSGGTVLTAKWKAPAAVYYVNSADSGVSAGTSPDTACSVSHALSLLSANHANSGVPQENIYLNLIVPVQSFTAPAEWTGTVPYTLTAKAPGGSTGSSVIALPAQGVSFSGSVRLADLTIAAGSGSETKALYACGGSLTVGSGVSMNGVINVCGGSPSQPVTGDPELRLFSGGQWGVVCGGGLSQPVTGDPSVLLGGSAAAAEVYGGGESAALTGSASVVLAGGTVSGAVHGGGKQSGATVSQNASVTVRSGTVGGAVYGGGASGAVSGNASVQLYGGTVGTVFGGGKAASAKVSGNSGVQALGGTADTLYGGGENADTDGAASAAVGDALVSSNPTVTGSVYGGSAGGKTASSAAYVYGGEVRGDVFGAGELAGSGSGGASVTLGGGTVSGSVYGGGKLGTVGSGTVTSGSAPVLTVSESGSATVALCGGAVTGSIFGGGAGTDGGLAKGAVFGAAAVTVTGGSAANVFGGGNRGYLSGNASVSLKAEQSDIEISGSVYGGGNLPPSGDTPSGADCSVRGKATVTLNGSGAHELTVGGSVSGGGSQVSVTDFEHTQIVIRQFSAPLELKSLRQAGQAELVAAKVHLTGAEGSSASGLGELRLTDGSRLQADKEFSRVEAIGNYTSSGGESSVSTEAAGRSTLAILAGKALQIKQADDSFGTVSGVLYLELVQAAGAAGGVSVQAAKADSDAEFVKVSSGASAVLELEVQPKEEDSYLWQLGGPPAGPELTLQALRTGSTGQAVATGSFTITAASQSSVIVLSSARQTGAFTLVLPSEDGDTMSLPAFTGSQTAGDTFALRVTPTSGNADSAWSALPAVGMGAYVLSSAGAQNGGMVIQHRSANRPATNGAGDRAEITLSLVFDQSYEEFSGGTVELTFVEYASGEELTDVLSTTVLTLTIEGDGTTVRKAWLAAGRRFEPFSDLAAVSVTGKSAVTGYFVTSYLPTETGAEHMALSLYRVGQNDTLTAEEFPAGARISMADFTNPGAYRYYGKTVETAASSLALSGFSSMGSSGSSAYPGHVPGSPQITEKLLFAVDFSQAPLSAGDYELRLTHSQAEEERQAVRFTVSSGTYSLGLSAAGVDDNQWTKLLTFTPSVPEDDARYGNRALIRLIFGQNNSTLGFSNRVRFVGAEDLQRNFDGSVTFLIPTTGSTTVTVDFSQVAKAVLPYGLYNVKAEMRPPTGLQTPADTIARDCISAQKDITIRLPDEAQRSISIANVSGSRVVNVESANAGIEFNLNVTKETGDTVDAVVCRKADSNTPDDIRYDVIPGASWCSILSQSGHTAFARLIIPRGTEAGTYRVLFRVKDQGGVLVEVPYNFIVE